MAHTLNVSGPAIPLFLGLPALEAVRLSGHEGVNSLFEYELILKTPDALNLDASGAADFNLDGFLGREVTCSIELDGTGQFMPGAVGAGTFGIGAGTREISAVVASAWLLGEDGRHLRYRLTLRPWLHLATHRVDCRIFQNMTVVDLLDEVLGHYSFPVAKRLVDAYPIRDYQVQLNESDFEFFSRLTQEYGISYFFEHSAGTHRLVLIDGMGAIQNMPSEAYRGVDYRPPGWKADGEYIHRFIPERHITSGSFTSSDYDYTRPRADLTIHREDPRPTGQADGEVYQWHDPLSGAHYAQPGAGSSEANDPLDEGRAIGLVRMQALRTHGARAQASGNLRGMVPGCSFVLSGRAQRLANIEYLVLDTAFLIEDVGQDSQSKGAINALHWKVEVHFTAHPMRESLRPALLQRKPLAGPQIALVVGPAGENVWSDSLGRIKVQFPWDRKGQKNEHSSCWVRVSSPWAGNQLGSIQLPRIGQEVIVDFIGNDPDLPICTGRVANQNNRPPWSLPGQLQLSGFRSRELVRDGGNSAAGRSNHLILDDTEQKIQAQLKSDHASSTLSLGCIGRIEDTDLHRDGATT